jgi:hypothetical protein
MMPLKIPKSLCKLQQKKAAIQMGTTKASRPFRVKFKCAGIM